MTGRDKLPPSTPRRQSRRRWLCCRWRAEVCATIALLLLSAGWPSRLAADETHAAPAIVDVRAGFAGQFKVGCWTPFEVTLEAGAAPARGRLELTVADCDGVPSRVHAPPSGALSIAAGEKLSVPIVAKIGQLHGEVTVGFRGEDGSLVTRRFATAESGPMEGIHPSADQLIVTLGAPLASIDATHFERNRATVCDVASLAELPTAWYAYDGADAVLLATGDDAIAGQLSADSPQAGALDQWVRMGGTLVLSIGRNAQTVLASTSPLAKLAPGTFDSLLPRVPSAPLETYSESSEPFAGAAGRFLVDVPKLTDVRGKIAAYAGTGPRDLPLVVHRPHGFGQVVFVACDLESAQLAEWPGKPELVDRLLGPATRGPLESGDETLGQVATLGFVDMSGQLRAALDRFAGVRLVPFWLVALLIVLYIACIGPLDYLLVRRVLGRAEATWFTFGTTVVVFSIAAYFLAYGLKGTELRVNRVDLVDFDAETKLVRGTCWANLFSPASRAYNLSIDAAAAVPDATLRPRSVLSWFGLPGDGFGGMNPRRGSMPSFTLPYDFSGELDRLERVPIAVWSSKPFVGRWWAEDQPPIEAHLSDDGNLTGTLACHFNAPLEDCVLIYDTWAYPLRTLEPEQRIDIDENRFDPRTVETYLRRVTARGDLDIIPPYEPDSFDIPRIVEIMSCYELAGGENYTKLTNEYQELVDLSGLVRNGRAILIGRRRATATTLVCDDEPLVDAEGQQWTFYRFVFAVDDQTGH